MTLPIATVTLNPSIDVPIVLDELKLGETNRCVENSVEPGGKGLNASRVIRRLGGETIAYGFAGGITGALLRRRLDDEGVPHEFDEIDEMTRLDVMVDERTSGRHTRLLPAGPTLGDRHLKIVRERLAKIARESIVSFGGSIPPGLDADVYREFVAWLNERGVRCIVDTSGSALARVLSARPALVKPNEEEAGEVLGRRLAGDADVLAGALELHRLGAQSVVISQAGRGAIGVDGKGAWKVTVPSVTVRSAVGCGDSMVGGMALALQRGLPFAEALRLGAAAGTATALAPGRNLCTAGDVDALLPRVTVTPLAQGASAEVLVRGEGLAAKRVGGVPGPSGMT